MSALEPGQRERDKEGPFNRMVAIQVDSSDNLEHFDAADKWQFEPQGDLFLIRNTKDGEYLFAARILAQSSLDERMQENRDLCRRMVSTSGDLETLGDSALWALEPVDSKPCCYRVINVHDDEALYACRHWAMSAATSWGERDYSMDRRMISTAPKSEDLMGADIWRIEVAQASREGGPFLGWPCSER
jgi:hypothetical protein|mmetsp:Transcript_67124/g.112361  ORF Transcript_67124/g.112361 Transcript_67124/m.112361 type:complete len:188 (+) Transcript_67124:135-698(+)